MKSSIFFPQCLSAQTTISLDTVKLDVLIPGAQFIIIPSFQSKVQL